MGLDHDDVRRLLAKFTYKPNWTFEVMYPDPAKPPEQPVRIWMTQYVEDSRQPFSPWDFRIREPFPLELREACIRDDRMGYALSPQRQIFPVGGPIDMPRIAREDRFWIWLHDVAIPNLERHEMSEWFRVDGRLMFDPHADDQPGRNR